LSAGTVIEGNENDMITLTVLPSDNGFVAKWITHNTELVDLINLEWSCCYPEPEVTVYMYNGYISCVLQKTNVFLDFSEHLSGEAEITIFDKVPFMRCKISGCFIDTVLGNANPIKTVYFNLFYKYMKLQH
jgi:hypothetical protein